MTRLEGHGEALLAMREFLIPQIAEEAIGIVTETGITIETAEHLKVRGVSSFHGTVTFISTNILHLQRVSELHTVILAEENIIRTTTPTMSIESKVLKPRVTVKAYKVTTRLECYLGSRSVVVVLPSTCDGCILPHVAVRQA